VVCVVTFVFSVTAVYQPWRAGPLNHYDVVSSIILTLIGIFGLIFVSLEDEIAMNQRFGQQVLVTKKEGQLGDFAAVLLVVISAFVALFGCVMVWSITMVCPGNAVKLAEQQNAKCIKLFNKLMDTTRREDFPKEAERLIHESTSYDLGGLDNFISKVFADQGTPQCGTTDAISIQKAKAKCDVVSA